MQRPVSNPSLLAKNYKIIIHPIFNETDRPFTYYGTVWITLTPKTENANYILLDAYEHLKISENNLFVYRSRTLSKHDFTDDVLEQSNASNNTNNSDVRVSNEWMTSSEENDTRIPYMIETLTEKIDLLPEDPVKRIANFKSEDEVTEIIVTSINHRNGKLNITIGTSLKIDHFYIVKINFASTMTQDQGLMYKSYVEEDVIHYFAATLGNHYESIFPCLPGKAIFDLRIYRRQHMRSISGTELINTEIVYFCL